MEKLIVGLGNPGLRYRHTKHNAGFWVVDTLAKQSSIALGKRLFPAQWGRGRVAGEPVIVFKPLTYMNLSGPAVQQCAVYFSIPPERVLVVLDDADLALGAMRLRPAGSSGGHNGMRSILESLGTPDIARLRLGIAAPDRAGELAEYVLRPFATRGQRKQAQQMVDTAVEAVACWVRDGIRVAMNQFNRQDQHDDQER